MTCMILNVKNTYANVKGLKSDDTEFEDFVLELADEVYAYAYELY